ncbi:MAG: hypothetical protein II781_00215 [Clostridia bacterium]|nr:hypothetical protein [Clostridia bacterium]
MRKSLLTNEAISKRNFYLMIIEGALFNFAASFIDGNAVVSVFINEATGSLQLAGLAATMRSAFSILAQFILGMYIAGIRDCGKVMHVISYFSRWIIGLMVPFLLLGMHGTLAALTLILLISLFFFSDGMVGLLWTEIGARTVPPKPRAAIQGYQQILAGIGGLGVAFIVKMVMDSPSLDFAHRYSWIFGLCGGVYLVNMVVLYFIRDFPRKEKPVVPKVRFIPYLRSFVVLWKADGNFRKIMYARILYVISMMISALIVLYGTTHANLTPGEASSMLYLQVIGQIIGGFTWVQITKRWGNTFLMMISHILPILIASLGIISFFVASATGKSCFPFIAVMVVMTGMNLSAWLGYAHRVIDTVDPNKRTGYLVLQSLLQFPFTFFSYFAGILAEKVSFLPVFMIVLISSLAGLALTFSLHRSAGQTAILVETAEQK